MAPVKRSTTAQRETRATRAATVAKKKTTASEKKTESLPTKKATLASTRPATSTRRGRANKEEENTEEPAIEAVEEESVAHDEVAKPARATRANACPTATLAAAPRRRVKVTPLDVGLTESKPVKAAARTTRGAAKETATATAKKSTRSKAASAESLRPVADAAVEEAPVAEEPKPRATRKTVSRTKGDQTATKPVPAKTRGRPKSQKTEDVQSQQMEQETAPTTRATRSRRVGSVALSEAPEIIDAEASRPVAGSRKKVTFQDLPSENDKENLPLPQSKAKKDPATKKMTDAQPAATGLRAKPLRKPIVAGAATRRRKATTASTKGAGSSVEDEEKKEKKKMPRALTPKKITQVTRSSSPGHEEDGASDGEDELNGGKTPVRDLSVSPRRPISAAIARALSPAKKLDFGQSLGRKSPDRTAVFRDSEAEHTGALASPARRPAASPLKDSIRDSPKRGLNEGAKLLFPQSQSETSSSLALNPNTMPQNMSTMLQSPKRMGALDPSFFSQSAVKKKSVSKSPFKASLLGSPAKRLFSPLKKTLTPVVNQASKKAEEQSSEADWDDMEVESDVFVTSHFRSSSSPLRVHRTEVDGNDMDFDESVLQVGSPLKVQKSPLKTAPPPVSEALMRIEESVSEMPNSRAVRDERQDEVIVPTDLDVDSTASQRDSEEVANARPAKDLNAASEQTLSHEQAEPTEVRDQPSTQPEPNLSRRVSVNEVLFRTATADSDNDTSEDELAGGQTPVKPLAPNVRSGVDSSFSRSRISTGITRNASENGFGFTPLAAQMSGWLASSPEKTPMRAHIAAERRQSSEFSPLAGQHIDGEVVISRDSTPVQKLTRRSSVKPVSSSRSIAKNRRSLNLRKSLAKRQSMAPSVHESPARDQQFEEYMEIRAMEEQAGDESAEAEFQEDVQEFEDIMDMDNNEEAYGFEEEGGDTILAQDDEPLENVSVEENGDLTTDLINFTNASDTAMVDFQKLAEEADDLASEAAQDYEAASESEAELEEQLAGEAPVSVSPDLVVSEHFYADVKPGTQNAAVYVEEISENAATALEQIFEEAPSPILQPADIDLASPSLLVIDQSTSPAITASASPVIQHLQELAAPTNDMLTPQLNLRVNERRIVNTVVSKIPLKPEGSVSPVKITKKRSRSFGNSDASSAKRLSFEDLRGLPANRPATADQSPDRRVRTSTAPSPGGTSTPASTRISASRISLGGVSAVTTPGQMSFAIDDFGESTLDGIEIPEDFERESSSADELSSPARPEHTLTHASTLATPNAASLATPATAKRSARRVTTPATTKKTPATARKASGRASINVDAERTPLRPVGKGVLHGAAVYVDVHTSEGADASGIFIELLTQMGAKCVKEWRWNPRASIAPDAENESAEQKIGITHVVYKDGGKRTLEKVRDAKGEVCCVGVAWVLDCERENKWLDESTYMVDPSIVPRGGSRRRKSMEPRALLVSNDGSVSASRPRRSVSAEMSELMKRELVNTPARGQPSLAHRDHDDDNSDDDDENDENVEQATPTGYVSYDPRTAMTPGTPYLVSQGKKLIQMSAPPKQHNKSLFADEDEENDDDDTFMDTGAEKGNSGVVNDAKKFRMKNLGDMAKRRRTLGFKPVVGSPLGRN